MAGSYTTEDLVSAVRLRGFLPVTDDTVSFPTDANIISLANQEMEAFLVPWVMQAREGHFITSTTIPMVTQQSTYSIPSRAAGNEIATLTVVDSLGNPVFPGITEADLEVAAVFPYNQSLYGQPTQFYFEGNNIVLVPAPADNSLSLKVRYMQRPNQLVATTSVGVITATTQVGGNYQVAYSGSPSGFTASATYEVVHAAPGFEVVALGAANGSGSGYIQFSGTIPSGLNVGDSLCLQDTANFPTYVPSDIYLSLFADWLALRISEIRGDEAQLKRADAVFKRTEKMSRAAYLGKRDKLAHRKISSSASRFGGRRPPFWVR